MSDEDNDNAIRVCCYCFTDLNLSMFGLEDDYCSSRCKAEWDAWFEAARDSPQ